MMLSYRVETAIPPLGELNLKGPTMYDGPELHAADLAEIESLASRVEQQIGRRRFMSFAAKVVAFTIPASMVSVVPSGALATGSARPMMMMGMMMGMMGMMGMRR